MKPANQYLMEYASEISEDADKGLCNISGLRDRLTKWLVRRRLKKIAKLARWIEQAARDGG